MDLSRTSLELIAHFDSPSGCGELPELVAPTRGVPWVLKWAAALGVLFFAMCVLLQLGYCVAAERALTHAARAGAVEATLPRATRESVVETIERRVLGHSISTGSLQIAIQQNGDPVRRAFRLADDDRISVAISLPANAVLPAWLRTITFCRGAQIESRAERQVPGRQIRTLP